MPRTESSVLRRWALGACVALPLLMLAANVLAWLRWGTDLLPVVGNRLPVHWALDGLAFAALT